MSAAAGLLTVETVPPSLSTVDPEAQTIGQVDTSMQLGQAPAKLKPCTPPPSSLILLAKVYSSSRLCGGASPSRPALMNRPLL